MCVLAYQHEGSCFPVSDLKLCLYCLLGLRENAFVRTDEHGGLKLTANARAALMSRLAGVPGVSTLPPALTGAGMPGVPADFSCSIMPGCLCFSAFLAMHAAGVHRMCMSYSTAPSHCRNAACAMP